MLILCQWPTNCFCGTKLRIFIQLHKQISAKFFLKFLCKTFSKVAKKHYLCVCYDKKARTEEEYYIESRRLREETNKNR